MIDLIIHTDGGSRGNPGKAASAFVVLDTQSRIVHKEGRFLGVATNNFAEYKAVVFALEWLVKQPKKDLRVLFRLDSQLVAEQIAGRFKVKQEQMRSLLFEVQNNIQNLKNEGIVFNIQFQYVPRAQNAVADKLVNETLDVN